MVVMLHASGLEGKSCEVQGKASPTSEEQGLASGVALGRGYLVFDVTQDSLGDLIQSLGTILQGVEGPGGEEGRGQRTRMKTPLKALPPHLGGPFRCYSQATVG